MGLAGAAVICVLFIFFLGGVVGLIGQAAKPHKTGNHATASLNQQSTVSTTTTTQMLNGHLLRSCKLPIKDNTDYSYCYFSVNLSNALSVKLITATNDNFAGANLSFPFISTFYRCRFTQCSTNRHWICTSSWHACPASIRMVRPKWLFNWARCSACLRQSSQHQLIWQRSFWRKFRLLKSSGCISFRRES